MKPLSQFPLDLGYTADHFDGRVVDAVKHTISNAERLAVMNASGRVLNRRSGRLARSIKTEIKKRAGKIEATLTAGGDGVRYARIHEVGGIVQGSPWLVFQLADGGWRKVQRVRIPARPYLGPAMDEALRSFKSDLDDEVGPLLRLEI